jgi:hypothetical protein
VHRRNPTRGKVVFESPLGNRKVPFALRLELIPRPPARLESEPFDVPAGATIDVGYGLTTPATVPGGRSTFTATLDCDWEWPRIVVDTSVDGDGIEAARWHDAALRHAEGGRDCRLTLESDAEGTGAGDALWSVPRLRSPSPTREDASTPTNVVLISLDTLRADHLSGYFYVRPTSPAIDGSMIARGTTFADASTTFPMTHIAHLGMFTSRYPAALPASGSLSATVPIRMLTEVLREAGFSTVGITEDGLVSHLHGFGWGFDRLVEHYYDPVGGARRVFAGGREMLEAYRDQPFFLFLHTYKVHHPYTPSDSFRAMFPAAPGDTIYRRIPKQHQDEFDDYDRCIRELDAHVAAFLATLDDLGLAERTLVILTSDHGEAFGEHGMIGHGFAPHQEAIRVPLVFRGPGILAGRRVGTPVSLVDVMPTILDVLGLVGPAEMQGRSLRPALLGRELPEVPLFFEWIGEGHVGVRIGQTKVVRTATASSTYHPFGEPDELAPQAGAGPAAESEIQRYIDDGARRRAAFEGGSRTMTIAPRMRDALRALGYVE